MTAAAAQVSAPGRTGRETLRVADRADDHRTPPWAVFDPDWYRKRYPDAPEGSAGELLEWHLTEGQVLGHSPNLTFDEEWQRQAWPGIMALIEARSVASAFDAWCRDPHAARPPHWLFEPREYRTRYPALDGAALDAGGFFNLYHHYLSFGAAEGRIGHALFDPKVYLSILDPAETDAAAMPYAHYLRGLDTGAPDRRTSVLFDPAWYRDRYPEAAEALATSRYRSALEHYLRNDRPTEFDPSPWFSEAYYLAENPGVAKALGPEGFRDGFSHFLAHGSREGRSPHPDLDLTWYASRAVVRADIEAGRAPGAFAHWISIGHDAGLPGRQPARITLTPAQAVALWQGRADAVWPLLGRRKLDFTPRGKPAITVIMAVRQRPRETILSLASLRAQYHGDIELILVGCDPAPGTIDLEAHVTGATILRFGGLLNDAQARDAGLICASAEAVLLLGDGVEPAPGAVDSALGRLTADASIGAVGGRLLQPHGVLLEAGGIIWREGRLDPYARDASPLAAEANFVRDVDFCTTLFLFARRAVLTALPDQAVEIAGTTHDAADLCTRVRNSGFRVVYDPDALAFLTVLPSDRLPDGQRAFIDAHADTLARQPMFDAAAVTHARASPRGLTRILFVEDSVPLRHIGSGFVRSNDVLRAMAASGASVTVVPMRENHFSLASIRAELPDTVEVMHELTAAGLAEFVARRRSCFDLIWIARTHNLDLLLETLNGADDVAAVGPDGAGEAAPLGQGAEWNAGQAAAAAFDPTTNVISLSGTAATAHRRRNTLGQIFAAAGSRTPAIVIDTEAVAAVRQASRAAMANQTFEQQAALRHEFRHLEPAMHVVAVTEAEAALIRPHHRGPVSVLGHTLTPASSPRRFEERTGLLFVGAIHATDHPNYDGLAWFIDDVLPLIEQTLGWETSLTVAGYLAPGVTLDRFAGHSRVTLRGAVADLAPLYDSHRVFIAPARFAAGIPYKVHEAAAFGLPVAASTLLAHQLGWSDGDSLAAASVTDPVGFAARVVALHRDKDRWHAIREAALARVAAELDPRDFASRVAQLSQPRQPDVRGEPRLRC